MREKINNIFRFDYGLTNESIPALILYAISSVVVVYGVREGIVEVTSNSFIFSVTELRDIWINFFYVVYLGVSISLPLFIGVQILEFYYKSLISENMKYSILPISKKQAMKNVFFKIGIFLSIYLVILYVSVYSMEKLVNEISTLGKFSLGTLYICSTLALISIFVATIGINLDIFISKYKVHKYIRLATDGVVMAVILSVMFGMLIGFFSEINIIALVVLLLLTLASGFIVLKNIDNIKIN